MTGLTRSPRDTLWSLTWAPTIWAAHFLLAYGAAAVYCAKLGRGAEIEPVRWLIAAATAVAVSAIALIAWRVGRRFGARLDEDDAGLPDDAERRHRFIGHATLLLCGLSAVATLYTALPAAVLTSCR